MRKSASGRGAAEANGRTFQPTVAVRREFQTSFCVTVPEFISRLRLKRAYDAVLTTDQPLKLISYEVGYQHTSNFCNAFKRLYGRTPTDLRRARGETVH